jgi:hypothetical protein
MIRILILCSIAALFLVDSKAQNPNALDFDGINDYVQTSYEGVAFTAPRTVEAWIKTTANADPNQGGIQQIITDWGSFTTGGRFTFNVLWNNAIRLEVGGNGVSGNIDVTDGQWHHVAAVFTPGPGNDVALYVDGELDVEGELTVAVQTGSDVDMRIGFRVDNERRFDGAIDEVRVWNYSRTQEELQADMMTEFCEIPPSLKAYYTFNHGEAGGNNVGEYTLTDYSGNDNDGSLVNFMLFGNSSNWVEGAPLELGATTTTETADDCTSYTWQEDGVTYYESGIYSVLYEAESGCDSIVSLDLTIHGLNEGFEDVISCESYTWSANDMTYTQNGSYEALLIDQYGCDSIATLNLLIGFPDEVFYETEVCDSMTWVNDEVLNETGTYIDTLFNVLGCDSVVILDLVVHTLSNDITDDSAGTLSASDDNATYQWLNCNNNYAVIDGETGQQFTPDASGSYAVQLSSEYCGLDTSDCTEVIITSAGQLPGFDWNMSPNPALDILNFSFGGPVTEIRFFNLAGNLVKEERVGKRTSFGVDISSLVAGLYTVVIYAEDQVIRSKFTKGD